MTKEQFEDIKGRLNKWCKTRGITIESQKENFKVNYTEELLEFFKAERDNNEYDMIDALCDMIVVAINAGYGRISSWVKGSSEVAHEVQLLAYDENVKVGITYLCDKLRYYGYDPYNCLIETIKELESRTGSWNKRKGKWCKDIGAYTKEKAMQLVYKKELYPPKMPIFTKEDKNYWFFDFERQDGFVTPLVVKKWYKADYSKCKA